MKLYANENNTQLISSMITKGREPHSIVICGEKGQGKKTLAKYIAAQLLCEQGSGQPCGHCKSCRMLEHSAHPDYIVAQSNENGNYQVDSIRALVADTVVKPNEGDFKVYLIPDFDRSTITSVQVQNILLKLIEEPPAHCVIILTATTKQIFLQTIISRVLTLTAQPCSENQARQWLASFGKYQDEQIACAIECGHGNFGACLEFLEGEIVPAAYQITHHLVDSILAHDEYKILHSLFRCDGKKAMLRQVLVFMSAISRDTCTYRLGVESFTGCYNAGAKKLSAVLNENVSNQLYELFNEYIKRIDSNCNLALSINSLAGEICRVASMS